MYIIANMTNPIVKYTQTRLSRIPRQKLPSDIIHLILDMRNSHAEYLYRRKKHRKLLDDVLRDLTHYASFDVNMAERGQYILARIDGMPLLHPIV
jgi:hypothetical protein